MTKTIRTETQEIVPRYYGLAFSEELGEANMLKVFDSPSTAAIAAVALTPSDTKDGLVSMLGEWRTQKRNETYGNPGYEPEFRLNERQAKKLLEVPIDRLVEVVRGAIHRNHGSYNLWDCSGVEAVSDLHLRGEVLTARVKSQEGGWYGALLKGAVRNKDGSSRYSDSSCGCPDNYWTQTKGGVSVRTRRNCVHVKAMELDSYLQETRMQHPARKLMREKQPHQGQRSMTFDFVDDPNLRPLIMDVLIAREVLGQSAYDIDRKLMNNFLIANAITTYALQKDVMAGNAGFEIIKHGMRTREIDSDLLKAQRVIDQAFSEKLRASGFKWRGYCLEMGREACRYQRGNVNVNLVMNDALPFYTVRDSSDSRPMPVFTQDNAPQNPFAMSLIPHLRLDDRTRRMTRCYVEPAVRINLPGENPVSLRYDLPNSVLEAYRSAIRVSARNPETVLKAFRIKY